MDGAPLAAPATQALGRRQSVGVIRWLVGVAVGLTGLANMASIFLPRLRLDLLLDVWPLDLDMETSLRSLAVVVGFLLIMLSRGLIRGKRTAWELTVALLALAVITHALHGGWVLATWATVLAGVLVLSVRPHFQARSDPPSVRRGYAVLLGGLALVFLYTAGGILWLRSQFEPVVRLRGLLRATLHAMAWTDHLRGIPDTPQVQFFLNAVPWLSICALAYGVFQLLRPVAKSLLPAPHEREIVKELIAQWGTSTISYIALSKEKSYFFHSSGQAGLAYRLVGNVAVVAGDPIGPEALLADVLAEFSAYCRRQDWNMVFWQVAHSRLPMYTARKGRRRGALLRGPGGRPRAGAPDGGHPQGVARGARWRGDGLQHGPLRRAAGPGNRLRRCPRRHQPGARLRQLRPGPWPARLGAGPDAARRAGGVRRDGAAAGAQHRALHGAW
jgi:phosphatidylglycerol lysyltransferase